MLLSVVALVPIIWLIIALAVLKLPGHWACFSALLVAAVLSLTLWQMPGDRLCHLGAGGVCRRPCGPSSWLSWPPSSPTT